MRAHGELRFFTGRICELEFASGFRADSEAAPFLQGFTILPVSEPVLCEAAEIMRELRAAGQGIGVADRAF